MTFDASEIERFVYEFHGGVTARIGRGTFTYALHLRGPEFKGTMARRHYWGGVYFSWSFRQKNGGDRVQSAGGPLGEESEGL